MNRCHGKLKDNNSRRRVTGRLNVLRLGNPVNLNPVCTPAAGARRAEHSSGDCSVSPAWPTRLTAFAV